MITSGDSLIILIHEPESKKSKYTVSLSKERLREVFTTQKFSEIFSAIFLPANPELPNINTLVNLQLCLHDDITKIICVLLHHDYNVSLTATSRFFTIF